MKIIQESAEHHFLTFLEKLRHDPAGWTGLHFGFSAKLDHDDIIAALAHIKGKIHNIKQESAGFAAELLTRAAPFERTGAMLYHFTDCDVILLAAPKNETERDALNSLFTDMAAQLDPAHCHIHNLAKDIYNVQKMADRKLVTARRMAAYDVLSDLNRIQSIGLRRDRRAEGMVLLVEDDRFTASFAANILNKDYDLIHSKTGEDAIIAYVEHAPDIVLLDIHLPGLNGHETLRAIKKSDGDAAIIMLSVDTVKQNIVGAAQGGAITFLKKP
ncbi:MAG: response regulator, partial [Alphaproteobacteria bacterium]|nr:response regulator [Alphaproteobacteria bacterium]